MRAAPPAMHVAATGGLARGASWVILAAVDEEEAAIDAARGGDEAAFAMLVRGHEGRVRATCRRILNDASMVEDCAQRAFTSAWRALGRFDGRARFSTWLYRIATNEALQMRRRERPDELLVDELPADARAARVAGPDTARLEREELRAIVRARLAELPDGLRIPVILRDVEEWSNEEIARELGLSLPAAKARIHRGRLLLRALLAQDLPERR